MLRVRLSGRSVGTVVAGSGEVIVVGRSPAADSSGTADQDLQTTLVTLTQSAPHVSRRVFGIHVGTEVVRLRYTGQGEAQLSSLFDAPAGARRVTLVDGMAALLDEGENQLLLLRGGIDGAGGFVDLGLSIEIEQLEEAVAPAPTEPDRRPDSDVTTAAPRLEPGTREWFVALALAEPWLDGHDDYPRPPSNREIYERVAGWNSYAWNLVRPQRVDDSIRIISRLAFGPAEDPFAPTEGRLQNVRFAVGRRTAEVRLVTSEDLAAANRAATKRTAQ